MNRSAPNFARYRFVRRGFTFVELCIGMVVTAMVLAAMGAFALASAEAWKSGITTNSGGGDTIAAIPIMGNLASVRLDREIGTALCTGGYFSGNLTTPTGQQASILLWKADEGVGALDPTEVYLIEYDATDKVIYKWSPTGTTPVLTYANFSNNSWIATFKPTATRTPLAHNVDGMQLYVHTPTSITQFPIVEYRLYFNRGGRSQTRYGAVCLRNPRTPSGLTLN